jgi:uncharacterized membrane protein YGL010W
MSKLNELAGSYGSYHQSKANQIMHMIGIPLIIASLFIMSNWFTVSFLTHGHVELSWLLIALFAIYYLQIDTKAALVMTAIYIVFNCIMIAICFTLTSKIQIILAIALFIIGWVLNFIGHGIEGKKPAFLDNILQTLIAPIFITDEILKCFKINLFNID